MAEIIAQGLQGFSNLELGLIDTWRRNIVIDSPVTSLFNMRNSQRAAERTLGISSMPRPQPRLETGGIQWGSHDPLGRTDYEHVEYDLGLEIDMTFIEDGEYGIIQDMFATHGESFGSQIAEHRASIFSNAFNANNPVSDGNALCSTARTGRLDNANTQALTYANLTGTYELMKRFQDENGKAIRCNPDTIVVPPSLYTQAMTLAMSMQVPGNDRNDINVLYGKLNVIVDQYITDQSYWFLVDSAGARRHLNWFWRLMPTLETDPSSGVDRKYRRVGFMRYSFGADNWTWIYGQNS